MIGKAVKIMVLGKAARMGPLGLALAAYSAWQQLTPKDQERVLRHARSLVKRARSRRAPFVSR